MQRGDKVAYYRSHRYQYGYIIGFMYWPDGSINDDVVTVQWFDPSDLDAHIIEVINVGDLIHA